MFKLTLQWGKSFKVSFSAPLITTVIAITLALQYWL